MELRAEARPSALRVVDFVEAPLPKSHAVTEECGRMQHAATPISFAVFGPIVGAHFHHGLACLENKEGRQTKEDDQTPTCGQVWAIKVL